MRRTQDGTPTPPEVVKAATQTVHLDPVALIGLFGSAEAPGALIRAQNGRITRVTIGDAAPGGRVAAIGTDRVVLAQRGKTTVLKLPA